LISSHLILLKFPVNPQWLFSAPKVCVSVNSYNLEDTKNISTTIMKTKNNLLHNNSTNKLIPSTLLPQSSSHRPTRQIFGPGTNSGLYLLQFKILSVKIFSLKIDKLPPPPSSHSRFYNINKAVWFRYRHKAIIF